MVLFAPRNKPLDWHSLPKHYECAEVSFVAMMVLLLISLELTMWGAGNDNRNEQLLLQPNDIVTGGHKLF